MVNLLPISKEEKEIKKETTSMRKAIGADRTL